MANATRSARRARKARTVGWSYSAGERGRNRVRVYEDGARGVIFAEFYERAAPGAAPVRKRISVGHADRERAKEKADEMAAAFRSLERPHAAELTLGTLFDNYLREVTPRKGDGKRRHDHRAAALFLECFGSDRRVKTLSVREWQHFIAERRSGALRPPGATRRAAADALLPLVPVRDRVIAYDLQVLRAALRWATLAGDGGGGTLLARNPLAGLPLPKEESPRRPALSDAQYRAMRRAADGVSPMLGLALVVARETGHRVGSIRQLRWSDVDVERGAIRWRAENDKIGFEHAPLASGACMNALADERRARMVIGDAWVFPAPADPSTPCSRHLFRDWWQRCAARAKLPAVERLGWHSLRRTFATEMKATPLKDLCYLGGWKNPQTLLTCYVQPDEETMRDALAKRRTLAAGSTR
ncbi:MAG: site-specific integrase [Gemmatimonadaceae bacterium]